MKKNEKNIAVSEAAESAAKKAAKAVAVFAATEKAALDAANARINGGLSKLAAAFFDAAVAARKAVAVNYGGNLLAVGARNYVMGTPAARAAFKDYAAARNAAATQTAAYKAAYAAADCAARGVYADFAAYSAAIKAAGGRWAKNPSPAADKSAAIKAGVAAKTATAPKTATSAHVADDVAASRPVAPVAPRVQSGDDTKTRAEKARAAIAACAAFTRDELIAAACDNRVAAKILLAALTAALADATAGQAKKTRAA